MAPERVLEERWLESKFSCDSREAAKEIWAEGEIDVLGDHRSQITSKIAKIRCFKGNDIIEQRISHKFCFRGPGAVDVPAIESRFCSDRLQGHPFVSGGDEHRTSGFQYGPSVCCVRWASRASLFFEISLGFASHTPRLAAHGNIVPERDIWVYSAVEFVLTPWGDNDSQTTEHDLAPAGASAQLLVAGRSLRWR